MTKPDWAAIAVAFQDGELSLRAIGAQYFVSEGAIRKMAKKHGWVRGKKNSTQKGTQGGKKGTQKKQRKKCVPIKSEPRQGAVTRYAGVHPAISSGEKPIRGSRHAPPIRPFLPHNTAAVTHGAYARRMLWPDDIMQDAQLLQLNDELLLLRAANLTAATNIGRWMTQLEQAEPELSQNLRDNIGAAERGILRNTARIESLERTLRVNALNEATTAKRWAETQRLTAESSDADTPLREVIEQIQVSQRGGRLNAESCDE